VPVFFTSDTHFGHAGARGLYRRPFDSVAAMDAAMLDRWNATVDPKDEIWHLGDFAHDVSETAMTELLGRKHLITGNNDPPATTGLAGGPAYIPMSRSNWMVLVWCSATTPSALGAT
jgi:calcineurin-like phosphoesterase family protein